MVQAAASRVRQDQERLSDKNDLYGAIATFKRTRTIMKIMVEQVDIVETLTPMSFNSFRDRLEKASGFQSTQFRELEYLLGYKRDGDVEISPRHAGLRDARATARASRRSWMRSTSFSNSTA